MLVGSELKTGDGGAIAIETAQQILDAARACDEDDLKGLAEGDQTLLSQGYLEEPLGVFEFPESDTNAVYADLVRVLTTNPPATTTDVEGAAGGAWWALAYKPNQTLWLSIGPDGQWLEF